MDNDPEQAERVKFEALLANEGRLRSQTPNLLKKQLYYDRLLKWPHDRNRFVDRQF